MHNGSDNKAVEISGNELLNSSVLLVLNDIGFTDSLSEKVITLMSEEEKCSLTNRHMHTLLREIFQL